MSTAVVSPERPRSLQESSSEKPASKRAHALDALRGLAILAMVLSGALPYGVFSSWMYHAQTPPPLNRINTSVPGITWVDLVFPFFLFAMGAAIPLALSRRIEDGTPLWKVVGSIISRGLLLGVFAVYAYRINPWQLSPDPTVGVLLQSLLGFALLFPVLARLPKSWSTPTCYAVRIGGWLAVLIFMGSVHFADGSGFLPHLRMLAEQKSSTVGLIGAVARDLLAGGFALERNDIILRILANMAVFGSLAWLLTRQNPMLRLGLLAFLAAMRFSAPMGGWMYEFYRFSPIPWLFQWQHLQYLYIVIPGTVAGEMILAWMKDGQKSLFFEPCWPKWRNAAIAALMLLLTAVVLVGLKQRWVAETVAAVAILCGLGGWLLSRPNNSDERLLRSLFGWGAFWLLLGLFLEPFEGGIKKENPTMSFYFVTTGLSICALIALSVAMEILKKMRAFRILIDNGQNPMLAYVAKASLVPPVLALAVLVFSDGAAATAQTMNPALGLARGLFVTLLVALVVSAFTRLRVFWRT